MIVDVSEMVEEFLQKEGPTLQLVMNRGDGSIDTTFSPESLAHISHRMAAWVASRLILSWNQRHEVPTLVEIKLDVQTG